MRHPFPAARCQRGQAPPRVKRTWNTVAACGKDMPRKPLEDGYPVAPPRPGYGKMSSGCRPTKIIKEPVQMLLSGETCKIILKFTER